MLRAGRLERGLTQEQLSARIGQPAAQISAYESGQSVPNPKVMAALAAELKLSSAVTDVHYVPKHSADPGAPNALDPEPAWETFTVDGAVPALPPVPAPSEEEQAGEPSASAPTDPNEPDGDPRPWSGVRPWADPARVLAEVPVEDSILPVDEPSLSNGPRPEDGHRPFEEVVFVPSSFVTASALPEDETRRHPTVDATVAIPRTVPDRPRSYLDLPGERSRYRVRALVTLVGLIALIYVIGWAMGRADDLFDAILDTIRAVT
ncbi:MAG TPA: helix-turn-helix transcriptional regulator [Acidimicrobiia bacterium]|nr:helix-turn-helix transcriptional regulator [Acidimicrobiia bacterium]